MKGSVTVRDNMRFGAGAVTLLGVLWLTPGIAHAAPMSDAAFRQILLLLCVVGVGYVVTHLAVEQLTRRYGLGHGVEYILLGVVLGPLLGLINPEHARDIRPILSLGAGALGMLLGMELCTGAARQSRGTWVAAAAIVICTGLAVVGLPLGALQLAGFDLAADDAWTGAVIASGVVVLGSDGGSVRSMAGLLRARGTAPVQGAMVAQATQAIAAAGFGVFFALVVARDGLVLRTPVDAGRAFGLQLAAGLGVGLLGRVVIHRALPERVLLMVLVGLVFLGGGLAYSMNVSAIFVNLVTGLVIGFTCRDALQITRMMENIKQPFVIALYFFAGLEWVSGPLWLFAVVPVLIMLRWVGHRVGGWLSARAFRPPLPAGPAMLAPGGLAVAFMLTLRLSYADVPGMRATYGPLLVAIVVMEWIAPRSVRRWLIDVADVPPAGRPRRGT